MWGAIIGAAVSFLGNRSANKSNEKSAQASTEAQLKAIEEQRRQFDLSRGDYKPFMDAGYDSINDQNAFLKGDWSGFQNSPDYAFALDQGTKALDRSAASRGRLYSGGYGEDLTRFGQGLATQNADNYWAKLAGRAGQGYSATSGLAGLGANMAGNIGNAYGNIGQARASSFANQGYNNAAMYSNLGNLFGQWYGNNSARNGGGTGWYLGNNPGRG